MEGISLQKRSKNDQVYMDCDKELTWRKVELYGPDKDGDATKNAGLAGCNSFAAVIAGAGWL